MCGYQNCTGSCIEYEYRLVSQLGEVGRETFDNWEEADKARNDWEGWLDYINQPSKIRMQRRPVTDWEDM